MRIGVSLAASALTLACTQPAAPPERRPDAKAVPPTPKLIESEPPINAREAAALSAEFGFADCSGITRLRDVRADGFLVESWRVRDGEQCFQGWSDRQGKYALLEHLDTTQAQRDRLPWLCGEDGAHVAQCSTQGRKVELVIEQPRFSPYLLFRRITKVAG